MTPEQAARRAQIVRLRTARMTFEAIGRLVGVSGQRVGVLYRTALAETPVPDREGHRTEEADFVDLATRELLRVALDPTTTPATQVEAWRALRSWAERKARLLGLDEPTQRQDLTLAEIQRHIERIEAAHTVDELADKEWDAAEDDDITE